MFPRNSAFNQERNTYRAPKGYPGPTTPPDPHIAMHRTSVVTRDIEDLEYDLRGLSQAAGSPEDARLFDDLADRVASFHRG